MSCACCAGTGPRGPCGCCEGVGQQTPESIENRPGLSALRVRVGTWESFFETMVARLSSITVPGPDGDLRPLARLATHAVSDFSVALLDAWAAVGDVLTFYQERIANEGYLRTATELRSIFELARLVGYVPRPGVAASTYLAFTMESGFHGTIDKGVRAQSLPAPGELPQSFETTEPVDARAELSTVALRTRRRQTLASPPDSATIWLKGVDTKLKVNDPILIVPSKTGPSPLPYRVGTVTVDSVAKRTGITLSAWPNWTYSFPVTPRPVRVLEAASDPLASAVKKLLAPMPKGSVPPRNALAVPTSLRAGFQTNSDTALRLFTALHASVADKLYSAYGGAVTDQGADFQVVALRVAAPLFGANAPLPPPTSNPIPIARTTRGGRPRPAATASSSSDWAIAPDENGQTIFLDNAYERIAPKTNVLVDPNSSSGKPAVYETSAVSIFTRSAHGIAGKTTKLALNDTWTSTAGLSGATDFSSYRSVMVYAQAEELPVDDVPEVADVGGDTLELDALYTGLAPGRWFILSGERADLPGVLDAERVMIAEVAIVSDQAVLGTSSDRLVTQVQLVNALDHRYVRSTVVLYGNVAHATHGETKSEVLGSGAPTNAPQSLTLKQSPRTYVSAPTETGVASTLEVRVDGVRWHELEPLSAAGPADRVYATRADDQAKTTVFFGDGNHGLPPPTGVENIRATYRVGLGEAGNVGARRITVLATRPLGVKAVINPIAATGGADAESRDQARCNVPLAAMALDRLVSVQDYADFARRFAGVSKAWAAREVVGGRQVVHVTIAGVDDAPITPGSDVFANLQQAFVQDGDEAQPVVLDVRNRMVIVLSASVSVDPDYGWDLTEPRIRAALVDRFGFERMRLEENVFASQVIALVQSIPGVLGLEVQTFGAVSTQDADGEERTPSELSDAILQLVAQGPQPGFIQPGPALGPRAPGAPARIACFVPTIAETTVLTEASS